MSVLRRRAAVSVVAVLALLTGGLAAAAPAQAATGHTYLQMTGDAGDYISQGGSYLYTDAGATFTATAGAEDVHVAVVQGSYEHWWHVYLRAPLGQPLVAGTTYTDAQRASSATPPHPGLDVYGDGRGCNTVSGSFTVLEIEKDAGTGDLTRFAATFEQHCERGSTAVRGTVAFNASRTPATITSTTAPTATVNGPVTVSGVLADVSGAVAGAGVTVSRPDGSGGTTTLPATTGAGGAFSVQDTIGTSAQTYTVEYAGDASHFAASTTITVSAVKAPSVITLTTPSTATRASSYTLSGKLTSDGVAVASTTVTLTRKDMAGTRTYNVTTGAAGTFSHKDTPAVGGSVSWTVSWPGSETQAAVVSKKSVTVSRVDTILRMNLDKTMHAYGTKVRVTVHLGTTYNNRSVSIYSRKATSGTTVRIKSGRVDSNGNISVLVPITVKTLYSAKFAGDYRYLPLATSRTVNVVSKVTMSVSGAYDRSGATYLVRRTSTPTLTATVLPGRGGDCVAFDSQSYYAGGWRSTASLTCEVLDYRSKVSVRLVTNGLPGSVRVRAQVKSGSYSSSGSTGWIYLKFV